MSKLPPVTSSNQFDEFLHTTQLVTHKSVNHKNVQWTAPAHDLKKNEKC